MEKPAEAERQLANFEANARAFLRMVRRRRQAGDVRFGRTYAIPKTRKSARRKR